MSERGPHSSVAKAVVHDPVSWVVQVRCGTGRLVGIDIESAFASAAGLTGSAVQVPMAGSYNSEVRSDHQHLAIGLRRPPRVGLRVHARDRGPGSRDGAVYLGRVQIVNSSPSIDVDAACHEHLAVGQQDALDHSPAFFFPVAVQVPLTGSYTWAPQQPQDPAVP